MFVGTTSVDRVVERTAQLMREHDTDDIRAHGGIPLDIIQRYLNFHFSVSLDLFGGETSSNVAAYYTAGLKGRWQEPRRKDDHRLVDSLIAVDSVVDGRPDMVEVPALTGLNQDRTDEDGVQIKAHSQVRLLSGPRKHLAHHRQLDRGKEIVVDFLK